MNYRERGDSPLKERPTMVSAGVDIDIQGATVNVPDLIDTAIGMKEDLGASRVIVDVRGPDTFFTIVPKNGLRVLFQNGNGNRNGNGHEAQTHWKDKDNGKPRGPGSHKRESKPNGQRSTKRHNGARSH